MIPLDKRSARKLGKENRKNISPKHKQKKDELIKNECLLCAKEAQKIGCYLSFDDEVNTHELINELLNQDKEIYVGCVDGDTLEFRRYLKTCLTKKNAFGIDEPINTESIPVSELDIIFVPLVAFDSKGNRVGYGKGYYDSILKEAKEKIGLAYREQEVDEIEVDSWDIPLDRIIYQ